MRNTESPRPIQGLFFYLGIFAVLAGIGSFAKGVFEKDVQLTAAGSASVVVGLGLLRMALK